MFDNSYIQVTTASGASLRITREEAERLLVRAGFEPRATPGRWTAPDGRNVTREQALPEAVPVLAAVA